MNPETEANRLTAQQQEERAVKKVKVIVEGKERMLNAPGPYVSTPEREARAQRIIALRKAAGRA